MSERIQLGEIELDVVKKDIKNIHLSVYPPNGAVRIAAPLRMNLDTIRIFAISKLGWIKQQRRKLQAQERETPREYLERESHYVWGQRYLLKVVEKEAVPSVELKHRTLILTVRPGASEAKRQAIMEAWYRQQLKAAIASLLAQWEPRLGVSVSRFQVRKMKIRWGTCSPATQTIRLNLELAKKLPVCLEYIVVHELMHLLEPTHNQHFIALMDQFLPQWRFYREELNRLPVRHEKWDY
jgi:predicted metal-dependent hydrolase